MQVWTHSRSIGFAQASASARSIRKRPAPPPIAAPAPAPAARTTPARAGKRLVAGHFDPKVAKALRLIAAEEDTTIQALLEEAIDLLLVKKGRAPMAR